MPSWPKPPLPGHSYSEAWIRRANTFAEFALTIFWPWPPPGTPHRFDYFDNDGAPCEAYEALYWRLDHLSRATERYDEEVAAIDE